MSAVTPKVGDIVTIMVDPFETGRVVETSGPDVGVLVSAGHVVRTRADEVRLANPPTITVRPLAEASAARLAFTLTAPGVVAVADEYGTTVAYPLRDLTVALLDLWLHGSGGVRPDGDERGSITTADTPWRSR